MNANIKKIVGDDVVDPEAVLSEDYRRLLYSLRGETPPLRASADSVNSKLFVGPNPFFDKHPERESPGLFGERLSEQTETALDFGGPNVKLFIFQE